MTNYPSYLKTSVYQEDVYPDLIKLGKWVLEFAEKNYKNAGFGGNEFGQNHWSGVKREAEAYLAALDGTVPKDWYKYEKQIREEADQEYKEYLRLKLKFGG